MSNFIDDALAAGPLSGFGELGEMCTCGFKPPHMTGMPCSTWCKGRGKGLGELGRVDRGTLMRAKRKMDEASLILKLAMEKL